MSVARHLVLHDVVFPLGEPAGVRMLAPTLVLSVPRLEDPQGDRAEQQQ